MVNSSYKKMICFCKHEYDVTFATDLQKWMLTFARKLQKQQVCFRRLSNSLSRTNW